LQLQADTQTTVIMLCLADLHVLDKKNELKKVGKIKKNVKKRKKNVFCIYGPGRVVEAGGLTHSTVTTTDHLLICQWR